MNSENKSLLLISVGPKTAPSRVRALLREPFRGRAGPPPPKGKPVQPPSFGQRASSEQQRSKVGFPIRKFPDQSLFAAPRNLSQRTTSFIASQRQGIHQIPLWHLIALIAKARSLSMPPIGKSAANSLWREKTSFASNASGDPSGQAWIHDWCSKGPIQGRTADAP